MADNIIKRVITAVKNEIRGVSYSPTNAIGLPYGFASYPLSVQHSLQLSATYRCVDVISDAIASQTWEILNYVEGGWTSDPIDPIAYMMNNDPSPSMSRYSMMKTLMAKVLLEGNGYLIINRPYPMGDPTSFTLVNDTVKTWQRSDGTLYYEVGKPGKEFTVDGLDMIHILNFSYDGLNGVSTLRHAANSISLAYSSEQTAKGFFESGANANLLITTEDGKRLTKDKADDIKDSFRNAIGTSSSNTSGYAGGIAVIEGGLKVQPISVNPKDAQMLETRKYNVIDICRFFGVHPSKVFDDSNLTYSNIESFQLGFITDTVTPWDCKIESEFNRKIFRPSKAIKKRLNLNINELLKANMDSTANYWSKLFQIGVCTPNEVRNKLGMPPVKGGEKAYVPMNMIATDTPITKNTKVDKQIDIKSELIGQIERKRDSVNWKKIYKQGDAEWAKDLQSSKCAQDFTEKLLEANKESILEIGCGNGKDSILFALAGLKVTAIDLVSDAIKMAKENAKTNNVKIDFQEGNAESLQFKDSSFDAIYSLSVLHSTNIKKSMAEISRVLKPKGLTFIYIYSDVQKIDGKKQTFVALDEFINLFKLNDFIIENIYTEQEDEYDEAGEKHFIIIIEAKK